jgi:hypothetical protein
MSKIFRDFTVDVQTGTCSIHVTCLLNCGHKLFVTLRPIIDCLCGLVVEFLATDPEARVQFPALADFLRSSGSGMGSTQLHEYN